MNVYLLTIAALVSGLVLWRNMRHRRRFENGRAEPGRGLLFEDMRESDRVIYSLMLGTLCLAQLSMFLLLAGMAPGISAIAFLIALVSIPVFGAIAYLAAQRAASRREVVSLLAPPGALVAYGFGLGILFGGGLKPLPL